MEFMQYEPCASYIPGAEGAIVVTTCSAREGASQRGGEIFMRTDTECRSRSSLQDSAGGPRARHTSRRGYCDVTRLMERVAIDHSMFYKPP